MCCLEKVLALQGRRRVIFVCLFFFFFLERTSVICGMYLAVVSPRTPSLALWRGCFPEGGEGWMVGLGERERERKVKLN